MKLTLDNTPPKPVRNDLVFYDGTLDDITGFKEEPESLLYIASILLGAINTEIEEYTKRLIEDLVGSSLVMREAHCNNYTTHIQLLLTRAQVTIEMLRLKGIAIKPKNIYVQLLGSYAKSFKKHTAKGENYLVFVGMMVDKFTPTLLTPEQAKEVAADIIELLRNR